MSSPHYQASATELEAERKHSLAQQLLVHVDSIRYTIPDIIIRYIVIRYTIIITR
jgi:hypothetical protein